MQRRIEAQKLMQERDLAAKVATKIREKEKTAIDRKLEQKLNEKRRLVEPFQNIK